MCLFLQVGMAAIYCCCCCCCCCCVYFLCAPLENPLFCFFFYCRRCSFLLHTPLAHRRGTRQGRH
ncbi:hypothetical protein MOQ_008524, partial [Trypanosoma cruzi marinkellei]